MIDYYNNYELVNMSDGRRPVKSHGGEQSGDGLGSIFASIFGKITKAGVSSAVKATAKQAVKTAIDTAKKELPGAIEKGATALGKTAVEEGTKFAVSTIENKIKRQTKKAEENDGTALNKPTRELSAQERLLQRARIQDIINQERLRLQRDKAEDEENVDDFYDKQKRLREKLKERRMKKSGNGMSDVVVAKNGTKFVIKKNKKKR